MEIEINNTVNSNSGYRRKKSGSKVEFPPSPVSCHDCPEYNEEKKYRDYGADNPEFKEELQVIIVCVSPIETESFRLIYFKDILECPEPTAEHRVVPEC